MRLIRRYRLKLIREKYRQLGVDVSSRLLLSQQALRDGIR